MKIKILSLVLSIAGFFLGGGVGLLFLKILSLYYLNDQKSLYPDEKELFLDGVFLVLMPVCSLMGIFLGYKFARKVSLNGQVFYFFSDKDKFKIITFLLLGLGGYLALIVSQIMRNY